MITKSAEELNDVTVRILLALGADERNATVVAEHLVSANLCGVDTHGIWHLLGYADQIRAGQIVPNAWPVIVRETSNSVLVSGNWTFGQVAAKLAMEVAIAKAEEQGMTIAGMVQSYSVGRLGHYAEMAAGKGMISLIWAGGYSKVTPAAVPYGGRKAVLHTNPLAMGFPAGEEPPMIIDFATTMAAGGKVFMARESHQTLPSGWIIDKNGNPSTKPQDFFDGGAYLPFGDHKGYGLMMAVEFLGRIFIGSDAFADAERGAICRHQGMAMLVMRADLFQPLGEYSKHADEMERCVRAVPPAPGFAEVLVPGDPQARTRAVRERDGIPLPDDIWQSLTTLAVSLGISGI